MNLEERFCGFVLSEMNGASCRPKGRWRACDCLSFGDFERPVIV